MRQQRRRNRPNVSDIIGGQPPIIVPFAISVADTTKIAVEFAQPVYIQFRPRWFVDGIESVTWEQTGPTIVQVDFQVPIPTAGRLIVPAWNPDLRGIEGEWLGPINQIVNPATPPPPEQAVVNSVPVIVDPNTVRITFNTPMQTPTIYNVMRLNDAENPTAIAEDGGPFQFLLTYASEVTSGNYLYQSPWNGDWLSSVNATIAPGQFYLP